MNVTDMFGAVSSVLGQMVKDTIKLRSLRKEDLQTLMNENIKLHQQIANVMAYGEARDIEKWMRERVKPTLAKNTTGFKDLYTNFVKQLRGKASSEESKHPMGALAKANEDFAKILTEIVSNIDQLMEEEAVDVFNVRITHIAALGIIRQSDIICNFSVYFYQAMVKAASHELSTIPGYRVKYLNDNMSNAATYTNNILDKKGPYTFLQEVRTVRSRAGDVVLGATGIFSLMPVQTLNFYMPNFIEMVLSALSYLNIFRIAMDAWDDYCIAKYQRNKETKEWLEAHVALLRMELNEMDPTSPEYIKTQNIIQAYDDKIADYDKEIMSFEQD